MSDAQVRVENFSAILFVAKWNPYEDFHLNGMENVAGGRKQRKIEEMRFVSVQMHR